MMRRQFFFLLLLIISIIKGINVHAQLSSLTSSYFKSLNSSNMEYDYSVYLVQISSGRMIDAIVGKLYRSGRRYVDSSSIGFAAVDNNYYCKIDYSHKTATVYDLKILQKVLHLEIESEPHVLFKLDDSVFTKYSRITIDTTSKNYYEVTAKITIQSIAEIKAKISKVTGLVEEIMFQSIDKTSDNQPEDYKRIYTIKNIKYRENPMIFDLGRIFSVSGQKISLAKKYSNYKLKTFNQ